MCVRGRGVGEERGGGPEGGDVRAEREREREREREDLFI